jgi:hypothetical protein
MLQRYIGRKFSEPINVERSHPAKWSSTAAAQSGSVPAASSVVECSNPGWWWKRERNRKCENLIAWSIAKCPICGAAPLAAFGGTFASR